MRVVLYRLVDIHLDTVPLCLASGPPKATVLHLYLIGLSQWRYVLLFHVKPSPDAQRAYVYSVYVVYHLFAHSSFAVFGSSGIISSSEMLQQTFSGLIIISTLQVTFVRSDFNKTWQAAAFDITV